jgi:hypothetical protein
MKTPLAIVRASAHMMPRLEAAESLLAANRTALGTRSLAPDDARALAARWERQTAPAPSVPTETAARQQPRPLPALGLGLKLVPAHG